MFRKAGMADLDAICAIYDEILTEEETGAVVIGWMRGVYPTAETAEDAIRAGDMFVEVDEGRIVAAARVNQEQGEEYAAAAWNYDVPEEQVMVLHTLVVSPQCGGRGYATRFVEFYESYAKEHGCRFLRMDTNVRNTRARALYQKLGFCEVDVVPCVFNRIPDVWLVCLEKKLKD